MFVYVFRYMAGWGLPHRHVPTHNRDGWVLPRRF